MTTSIDIVPLRPRDALDLVADGLDDTAVGALAGRPVLLLDLEPPIDRPVLQRLGTVLAGRPCVVVGMARSAVVDDLAASVVDVALCADPAPAAPWVGREDVDEVAARLVDAVLASPAASIGLVQLLRLSASSRMVDAVVAESFVYGLLQAGDAHRDWLRSRADQRRHARPDHEVVRIDRHREHLTIVLDRPEVRNAFGTRMRDGLVEAFRLVAVDPTVVSVTLRGNGASFSSGGDLDEFGTAPAPPEAHLVRTTRNAGVELSHIADRVTAHVHGRCVGAGVELPAFAGRVVADPDATFLLPEIAMGLVPGAGGTASIPRRIGRHRTALLALLGEPIDASTALDWGLVDAIVPMSEEADHG